MRTNRSSRQAERIQSSLSPLVYDRDHRAQEEQLLAIFRVVSDGANRVGFVGPDSFRKPGPQCSQSRTLPAPQIITNGSAPSVFDPSLEYSMEQMVLFWQLTS